MKSTRAPAAVLLLWAAIATTCALAQFPTPIPGVCQRTTTRPPPLTPEQRTAHGPTSGSLIVAGGSVERQGEMFDYVLDLGGGLGGNFVYVPTASGQRYETEEQIQAAIDSFWALTGWVRDSVNLTLVHTYDPEEADTDEFCAPLYEADGIWFGGGRQWRLSDAYLHTQAQRAFESVLERGGLISGSSAGAAFQGDVMIRGDTATTRILLGDHLEGFGYVSKIGFDPHHLQRGRADDMVEYVMGYPEHLGLGLSEDAAVMFLPGSDEFEVIGNPLGLVTVYDNTLWEDEVFWCSNGQTAVTGRPRLPMKGRYLTLNYGCIYDVHTREITRWRGGLLAE